MKGAEQAYLPLTGQDDKAKEHAAAAFFEADKREAFFKEYKRIAALYEILSLKKSLENIRFSFGYDFSFPH